MVAYAMAFIEASVPAVPKLHLHYGGDFGDDNRRP